MRESPREPAPKPRVRSPRSVPAALPVWRLAAPDTTTGQVPPGSIRATYQQESGSDVDRYRDALMPRMRKSPPDTGKRETDPESSTPGEVEK